MKKRLLSLAVALLLAHLHSLHRKVPEATAALSQTQEVSGESPLPKKAPLPQTITSLRNTSPLP